MREGFFSGDVYHWWRWNDGRPAAHMCGAVLAVCIPNLEFWEYFICNYNFCFYIILEWGV